MPKNTAETITLICLQSPAQWRMKSSLKQGTNILVAPGLVSTKMPMKPGCGQEQSLHHFSSGQQQIMQVRTTDVWPTVQTGGLPWTVTRTNLSSTVFRAALFWWRKTIHGRRRWNTVVIRIGTWSTCLLKLLSFEVCRLSGSPRQITCGWACATWLAVGCGFMGTHTTRCHSALLGVTAVELCPSKEKPGTAGIVQTNSTLYAIKILKHALKNTVHTARSVHL